MLHAWIRPRGALVVAGVVAGAVFISAAGSSTTAQRYSRSTCKGAKCARHASAKTLRGARFFTIELRHSVMKAIPAEADDRQRTSSPRGQLRQHTGKLKPTRVTPKGKRATRGTQAASSPSDSLAIFTSNDLRATIGADAGSGWEPSVAKDGQVVLETGNFYALYSTDGGATFHDLDPSSDFSSGPAATTSNNERFCCDQRVIYSRAADLFIWVRQTDIGTNGENRLRVAVATPTEIRTSAGATWHAFDLTPYTLYDNGRSPAYNFDFPSVAVDQHDFFLSVNLWRGQAASQYFVASALIRIALSTLSAHQGLAGGAYLGQPCETLKVAQNSSTSAFFACMKDTSDIRAFAWDDASGSYAWRDDPIWTHGTDYDSYLPGTNGQARGRNWLGLLSKINDGISGATVTRSQTTYVFTAGRGDGFNQLHIEILRVSNSDLALLRQDYVWNPDYVFVYPDVATNSNNEIGLIFSWGGDTQWVHSGIGFLTGNEVFVNASPDGAASGAHYSTIGVDEPNERVFVAGVFWAPQNPDGTYVNHPQFIRFGRSTEGP
jgi:hypothetical protein